MARRHVPVLLVPVLLVLASVVAVAGCSATAPPAPEVPDTGESGVGHVHGDELNPAEDAGRSWVLVARLDGS